MKTLLTLILTLVMANSAASQTYTIRAFAGGGLPEDIPATSASLGFVRGIAADAVGNLYIALEEYHVILRRDSTGKLARVAGSGTHGYSGDGGPATSAQVASPQGVAFDAAGNLYIADSLNHRIRKVTNGIITTVAGNGTAGYSGDNGAATSAQLNSPRSVAVNSVGDLFIADCGNHRVRKVSNGVIITVAGMGTQGYSGDNGPAASAQLAGPEGVAVDSFGTLYIADTLNHRVRMISDGVITTIAGNGVQGYAGDNGPATSAHLSWPNHVIVDSAGDLHIADSYNHRIRKVSNRVITTIAGNGAFGYGGDNGAADSAQLNYPSGVCVGPYGTLYIADSANRRIRQVANGTITTIAGNGAAGDTRETAPAASAQLGSPAGVAVDPVGRLYLSEFGNHRVRKVANGLFSTAAGTGVRGYSGDNGPASGAQLGWPKSVAMDSSGNLYIADSDNYRIRKVSSGVITTVAGNGKPGYWGDNGPANDAEMREPTGIAVDLAGNLYIADSNNHRIRKVSNGVITTVAGNGIRGFGGDNGPATSAQLRGPTDVAVDAAGNLYIADSTNHRVRKVSDGVITTIAGNGVPGFGGDGGPATSAQLHGPAHIAVDSAGDLYIADFWNYRIRKVSNGVITTIAGTGTMGYSGDDGPALGARLGWTESLTVDPLGNVYISDSLSQRVRVLTPGAPSCDLAVSTADLGVAANGGILALSIRTGNGCPWSLAGLPEWLTASGALQGTGPAEVSLVAAANPGGMRTASVSIGTVSVPIRQFDSSACGSGSCVARALPHVAAGGEWATNLFVVSSGTAIGSFSISFFGDNGSSLALPFAGEGNLNTLSDSVPAQGRKDYEAGNAEAPPKGGWGLLVAEKTIAAQATFRRATTGGSFYEASVPASEGYSGFIIPFDASAFPPTGGLLYTGFAIANLNPNAAAHVTCTARDRWGGVIPDAVQIPTLNPSGHYANYLFPALTGKRGTLDCAADTLVSAIALRSIGTEAFSTLPVIVK